MSKKRIIGWQKYEDLLEQQINNNFFMTAFTEQMELMHNKMRNNKEGYEEEDDDEEEEYNIPLVMPFSAKLIEDSAMLSNYDCWLGHTNFDITKDIKTILDKIDGIEVLKICSRYRFFIGIGKMFDFKTVRGLIEKELI